MPAKENEAPKLTVEMVPRTCWYTNLRTMLSKEDWDKMRRWCYTRAGYVCEICGGVGPDHPVEAHEIWEYDDLNAVQRLAGLIALCPMCHRVKHLGHAVMSGKGRAARVHLMEVNDWSARQAHMHVRLAGLRCFERGCHEWRLDLSWLDNFDVTIHHVPRSEPEPAVITFDFEGGE